MLDPSPLLSYFINRFCPSGEINLVTSGRSDVNSIPQTDLVFKALKSNVTLKSWVAISKQNHVIEHPINRTLVENDTHRLYFNEKIAVLFIGRNVKSSYVELSSGEKISLSKQQIEFLYPKKVKKTT